MVSVVSGGERSVVKEAEQYSKDYDVTAPNEKLPTKRTGDHGTLEESFVRCAAFAMVVEATVKEL